MDIAHNIRKRRLELGVSQQDLAQKLGYKSRSAIAKMENGTLDIPLSKLLSLAKALDTTVDSLLSDSVAAVPSGNGSLEKRAFGSGRTAAIILAGGKSTRNLKNIPNQFIDVMGKPVLMYCAEQYQRHPLIDDIYFVCLEGWGTIVETYAHQFGITKMRGIVRAGKSGIGSIRAGFHAVSNEGFTDRDFVILQESTRPLVSQETISKVLLSARGYGHAITGSSMEDSVQFMVSGSATSYIERSGVMDLQSPDAYQIGFMREVFEKADKQGAGMSASCMGLLMDKLGYSLNFCEGNRDNIKIIRQQDLAIFSALLKQEF